jgi:O-antigen ligase
MSPLVAAVVFAIGIIGVFYLDRDKKTRVSIALWLPAVWMFFCFSRPLSEWLGMTTTVSVASTYVEGSPLDRALFTVLEILALIVVITRLKKLGPFLRNNWAIVLFFIYAGFSILWSDFPFVTFKHWIKGVGDLMMVLIVLTEPKVSVAIERLFTWLGFVLVPLSVLFIKYYPDLGRRLTLSWTMEPVGVAEQKNSLGELCDFFGLVLLWRFRNAYMDRNNPNRKRHLVALGAVLAMVVSLLWMCNSMTSICALGIAAIVMMLSTRPAFRYHPLRVHLLIVALLTVILYGLFFQSSGSLIQSLGRNPSLTGRTDIWKMVLSIPNNRLLGVWYESFWLGSRLQTMWNGFQGLQLNEAHNGYVEILITLGWIGELLLGLLIVMGYRNVMASYRRDPMLGSLRMALFLAAIVTGLTEAAFRMMGPPWIIFLLASAAPIPSVRKAVSRKPAGWQTPPFAEELDVVHEEVPVGFSLEPSLARVGPQVGGRAREHAHARADASPLWDTRNELNGRIRNAMQRPLTARERAGEQVN